MSKIDILQERIIKFQKYKDFYIENKDKFPNFQLPEIFTNTTNQEYEEIENQIKSEYNKNKYWIAKIPDSESKKRFMKNLISKDPKINGFAAMVGGLDFYLELTSKSIVELVTNAFNWHESNGFNDKKQKYWSDFLNQIKHIE